MKKVGDREVCLLKLETSEERVLVGALECVRTK